MPKFSVQSRKQNADKSYLANRDAHVNAHLARFGIRPRKGVKIIRYRKSTREWCIPFDLFCQLEVKAILIKSIR